MKLELINRLPMLLRQASGKAAAGSTDGTAESVQAQVLMRWRQLRRQFDSRLPNERRLIILALVAGAWFACDSTLITPGNERWHAARERLDKASQARDAMQAELQRKRDERARMIVQAEHERSAVKQRLADGQQELERQQSMMAPAREMRTLLEGLLAQHGGLRLERMQTLDAKEVKISSGASDVPAALLFNHGLQVSVSGSYMDLLSWLHSVETMPKRLMWDSLSLSTDETGKLTLTMVVHTFSPDRDALEMAP